MAGNVFGAHEYKYSETAKRGGVEGGIAIMISGAFIAACKYFDYEPSAEVTATVVAAGMSIARMIRNYLRNA